MRHRLFRLFAALFLLVCAAAVGLIVIGVRHALDPSAALRTIADNGAAASKPMPTVTVFVPETGGGEKKFGDQQLLAILPALPHVDYFDTLDLHGSSVTDSGVGQLQGLTQLETLDDILGESWTSQPNSLVFVEWVPHRLAGDADFNIDGSVGVDDLVILARNYGTAVRGRPQVVAAAGATARNLAHDKSNPRLPVLPRLSEASVPKATLLLLRQSAQLWD